MEQSKEEYLASKMLFTDTDHEIKYQINQLLYRLGCKQGILSTIGSWKDTLSDSDILLMIKDINKDMREELIERSNGY